MNPYLTMTAHGPALRIHPDQPLPSATSTWRGAKAEPWADGDQSGIALTHPTYSGDRRIILVFDPTCALRAPSTMGGGMRGAAHEHQHWLAGRLTEFTLSAGVLPPNIQPRTPKSGSPVRIHPEQALPKTLRLMERDGERFIASAQYGLMPVALVADEPLVTDRQAARRVWDAWGGRWGDSGARTLIEPDSASDFEWSDIAWAPPRMPDPKRLAGIIDRAVAHVDQEPTLRDLDPVSLRRRLALTTFRLARRGRYS